MSIIDRNNNLTFKSAEFVFSDVKRMLKSYDNSNMIDEGEFPLYLRDVLKMLGRSVMKGSEAILKVNSRVLDLPDDYEEIYAAYRCKEYSQGKVKRTYEQGGATLYNDITRDVIYTDKNCKIGCYMNDAKIIERITIKQMVADTDYVVNFSYPQPLYVSHKSIETFAPYSFNYSSAGENCVTIADSKLYVNFDDDWLYLQYYGHPKDEYGVHLIPDINSVYQAIKWYIIYQVALSWWWNNDVPDIQNKWQEAESQFTKWLAESSYETKLPSFGEVMDSIKSNRETSLTTFFSRNMYR